MHAPEGRQLAAQPTQSDAGHPKDGDGVVVGDGTAVLDAVADGAAPGDRVIVGDGSAITAHSSARPVSQSVQYPLTSTAQHDSYAY